MRFETATIADIERYGVVAELDPLGFDAVADQLPAWIAARELRAVLGQLAAATGVRVPDEPLVALAALRDLEFLLTVAHALAPHSYKDVPGLEELLVALGRVARHAPRGSVFTYGACNPPDGRMRTFTGTAEERLFIRGLRAAIVGLDRVLAALSALAALPIDSAAAEVEIAAMQEGWEPMVTAAVEMRRHMPPELFSCAITPYFGELEIAGVRHDGNTGAHMQAVAVDWVLHGVGSTEPGYRAYAEHNLAALRPHQRRWVEEALAPGGGNTPLLPRLQVELASGVRDPAQAAANLAGLHRLLTRVGTFRKVHLRLAETNLPLRPTPTGSGGHTLQLLEDLASRTREARRSVQEADLEGVGPLPRVPAPRRPPGVARPEKRDTDDA